MKVVCAKTAGFCFGVDQAVKRTVRALKDAGDSGRLVYSYGEIIHNANVIDRLEKAGLRVLDDAAIDCGGFERGVSGTDVIIRAHGARPDVYAKLEAMGVNVIDATCPFVEKIHRLAAEARERGDHLVIVGNPDHPEVTGIKGYGGPDTFVSDDPEEITAHLEAFRREMPEKGVSVVEQTTFSKKYFENWAEIAKKGFDNLTIFDTICSATSGRQRETAQIAQDADLMIVVGDRKSSNTEKLYRICQERCPRAVWVESAKELDPGMFADLSFVGVTAGASTPDWIIEEVIGTMSEIDEKIVEATEETAAAAETAVNEATAAVAEAVEETVNEAAETVENAEETVEAAAEAVTETAETAAEAAEETAETAVQAAEDAQDESFASLLEDSLSAVKNGDVVKGCINKIDDKGVYIDFGFKYEGFIAIDEFQTVPGHGTPDLKIGDEVEAQVVKVNDKDCETILSKRRLDNRKNMELREKSFAEQTPVTVKVTEAVKGGVVAFLGSIRIFIPASQLAERYIGDISQFVGKDIDVVIIALEKGPKGRNKILGSRKVILAAERAKLDETFWADMYVGKVCVGKVKSLTPFGAFVDLGGYDGLIHLTELSWSKIHHPSEVLSVGDEVEVRVIECDPEKKRISLGYRKAEDDPWADAEDLYQVGDILEVTVVRFVSFGVFVNIATGVDGLVHISQISNQRISSPADCLKIGQKVMAKIIETNIPEKKINLSIREVQAYDPEPKPEELDENGNPIVRERKERKHKDKGPKGEKKNRHSEDNEIHGDKVPASMGTSIGDILASKLQGMPEVLSAGVAEEEAPAEEKPAE